MKIEKIIETKNLKLTSARKELLEIFYDAQKPLSFEDVKAHISMDKATFYRNISKFEDASIVSSFESNDKKRYYEVSHTPHAHFICNHCNRIECLTQEFEIDLNGYIVQDMILKGLCPSCVTS